MLPYFKIYGIFGTAFATEAESTTWNPLVPLDPECATYAVISSERSPTDFEEFLTPWFGVTEALSDPFEWGDLHRPEARDKACNSIRDNLSSATGSTERIEWIGFWCEDFDERCKELNMQYCCPATRNVLAGGEVVGPFWDDVVIQGECSEDSNAIKTVEHKAIDGQPDPDAISQGIKGFFILIIFCNLRDRRQFW